jgi:catechol 2,3-dioxygenase-like lactoylglutathione lyase family enzyme
VNRFLLTLFACLAALPSFAADSVARPKILSIAFVRLKSTNLGKSNAFYGQVLGLASGAGDCQGLPAPCYTVNAHQHVELSATASGTTGSFLDLVAFNVSDVSQMQKFLASHGIKTSDLSRASNGLQYIEAQDPEGNRLAFFELSAAANLSADSRRIGNQLIHAGFVVNDLDRMKKFYVELLGFRLYWYGGFKDVDPQVATNKDVDWYEIQVPDGNNWVEFMLNISPTADHRELGVQNHFSLGVNDANAAAAIFRSRGAGKFDGPEVGRDGKNSIDIYDPDLSRVEVMDWSPTKTPCCHPYTAAHPKP